MHMVVLFIYYRNAFKRAFAIGNHLKDIFLNYGNEFKCFFFIRMDLKRLFFNCENNLKGFFDFRNILNFFFFSLGIPLIGLVGRVFANIPGDLDSIPGRVIPKTLKWYLIPPCLTLSKINYVSRVK